MSSTTTTSTAAGCKARRVLAAALVIGALVRGVILWNTASVGTEIVDEQHYTRLARNILDGNGFAWDAGDPTSTKPPLARGLSGPTSARPPLYPGVVAAIWALTGRDNLQAIRFVQILMALATAGLIYGIGRRVFNEEVGCYAAAVVWSYPSLLFENFTILTETLFTLLLLAFVLLTVMLLQSPRTWIAAGSGLALGLAALTRSILWPVPVVLCPLLAALLPGSLRSRLGFLALVLAGYAAAVGPWAVRNTRLQGVFTVVDTMGGPHLRIGNFEYTPDDRMWASEAARGQKHWTYDYWREHGTEWLTEGQRDKWAQRKALAYMRAHPLTTLRRSVIKFRDFWGLEREYAAGVERGAYAPPRWFGLIATAVIVLTYVAVAVLGAAGMWLAPPDWRSHAILLLPVLVITGAHTLAFGHSRYHLPLIPILCLYAAALFSMRGQIQLAQQRLPAYGAALAVLALLAIWVDQIAANAGRIRGLLQAIV